MPSRCSAALSSRPRSGSPRRWPTVALALHLPAIGWVETRTRVAALRWVALGIAAAVLVRLVANPYALDYPLGPTPIFNWLLYGYGVPAAAFIVATRQFGDTRDDALVWVLEGGSIAFSLLLLTLELIHALYGRLTMAWLDDFGDASALFALWLAFAVAVIALGEYRQRPVLRWGGRLRAERDDRVFALLAAGRFRVRRADRRSCLCLTACCSPTASPP